MLEKFKKLFPDPVIKEEDLEKYKRARGLYIEDPWERVKTIFSRDDFGSIHPDLQRALRVGQTAFCFGAGIGAINESIKQSKEFVRTNDTNAYRSEHDMYKILSNKSILAMGKGGLKWGPKIGLFAGGFTLIASCCEAYRNKPGIIEYVIGGYIAGGISKSMFGIKGVIAGGIVGAMLGLIYGTLHVGFKKLTKTDDLVLKYSQFAYARHREELLNKTRGTSKSNSTDELIVSLYGEHSDDPLDTWSAKDENSDPKDRK